MSAVPQYNECIAGCIRAEESESASKANAEVRAMVLRIKGDAYLSLAKCAKDYDLAIKALDMALKVKMDQDTWQKVEQARRAKAEAERREHRGDKERELGVLVICNS